jgi:prepilin-type N-terminal cleavage/methylation domain-containing protein
MALSQLCSLRAGNNTTDSAGFTLVELITVVAIIGILSKISMMVFLSYRTRTFDTSAKEDLRNIVTFQEAHYSDSEEYVPCGNTAACQTALPNFKASNGVQMRVNVMNGTRFVATAFHDAGDRTWRYDSSLGTISVQ